MVTLYRGLPVLAAILACVAMGRMLPRAETGRLNSGPLLQAHVRTYEQIRQTVVTLALHKKYCKSLIKKDCVSIAPWCYSQYIVYKSMQISISTCKSCFTHNLFMMYGMWWGRKLTRLCRFQVVLETTFPPLRHTLFFPSSWWSHPEG